MLQVSVSLIVRHKCKCFNRQKDEFEVFYNRRWGFSLSLYVLVVVKDERRALKEKGLIEDCSQSNLRRQHKTLGAKFGMWDYARALAELGTAWLFTKEVIFFPGKTVNFRL